MKLVPVIDLRGGKAVAARMGRRETYAPLATPLCDSSRPAAVVAALLRFHPFDTLYIADLDAIGGTGDHLALVEALHRRHPQVTFWVDNGLKDLDRLARFARPVIGTESLDGRERLRDLAARLPSALLSLDFRDGRLAGPAGLEREAGLWPEDVIVMSLSRIGSGRGPDLALFERLLRSAPGRRLYAAGGVRDARDLERLGGLGAAGALVSTALHQGRIAPPVIGRLAAG